jgi:hypothetical protein
MLHRDPRHLKLGDGSGWAGSQGRAQRCAYSQSNPFIDLSTTNFRLSRHLDPPSNITARVQELRRSPCRHSETTAQGYELSGHGVMELDEPASRSQDC